MNYGVKTGKNRNSYKIPANGWDFACNVVRGCLRSDSLMDLTFELLCDVRCDPLWFNDLFLTTKLHQGLTKVHKVLFQQLQPSKIYQ